MEYVNIPQNDELNLKETVGLLFFWNAAAWMFVKTYTTEIVKGVGETTNGIENFWKDL